MRTLGKVTDSAVLIGSLAVGYGAIIAISQGVKSKKGGTIALGVITALISVYAFNEARQKLND